MNVAVLFSGAKDSTFAIYKAMNRGMNVKYLVTIIPQTDESYMFHYPNVRWTKLQAKAMGIKLITRKTKGEKESELEDLEEVLKSIKPEIQGVVSGALESRYQKARIDDLARKLGLESFAPHWQRSMRDYLQDLIVSGFEIIVTSVSAEGLNEEWLGRRLDHSALNDLAKLSRKYGIHKGFEGGEAETFVLDGPIFNKRIEILEARKEWNGVRGIYLIEKAKLVDKN
ncbi:MAG: TIGR00289 family protein [Candidatus Aenigmarchaeota archaeon]|nr:TIGR00289 family protein [Candidatus Aenigmarchaeota archaeon]NIP40688.1 TIGR00289 family protein [Candidatus Aenigmarchaeota archaeon]NIQ18494.1 TIGR00289 family protein [Candidatus Aenigmarchaeota archaeon]NIS73393.1 TIGR00289 family protein [Candidatus Aenigmarchaeota archaeon]